MPGIELEHCLWRSNEPSKAAMPQVGFSEWVAKTWIPGRKTHEMGSGTKERQKSWVSPQYEMLVHLLGDQELWSIGKQSPSVDTATEQKLHTFCCLGEHYEFEHYLLSAYFKLNIYNSTLKVLTLHKET